MRIALGIFLGITIFAIPTISTQAIYPFGGKIVAYVYEEECSDPVIIVVGPKPGIFEFELFTQWFTLPFPPLVGTWTIGTATHPGPCGDVILGGASAIPSP